MIKIHHLHRLFLSFSLHFFSLLFIYTLFRGGKKKSLAFSDRPFLDGIIFMRHNSSDFCIGSFVYSTGFLLFFELDKCEMKFFMRWLESAIASFWPFLFSLFNLQQEKAKTDGKEIFLTTDMLLVMFLIIFLCLKFVVIVF